MESGEKLNAKQAHLSNERTLLSHIRTSASVSVLAVAMMQFFESKIVAYLGQSVDAMGIIIQSAGIWRYKLKHRRIREAVR